MAQRTVTTFFSDLSGMEIADRAGGTVRFAVDGSTYEMDLMDEQGRLREARAPFIAVARKVPARGVPGASRPTPSIEPSAKEIRAWAMRTATMSPFAVDYQRRPLRRTARPTESGKCGSRLRTARIVHADR